MKKVFVCAIMILIFTACSRPITTIDPKHIFWKNYEINQPIERSTGSAIIHISSQYGYQSFDPRFIQEFPGGTLIPGHEWYACHTLDSDESKFVLTSPEFNDDIGIIINQNGELADDRPIMDNLKIRPFRKPYKRKSIENLKDKHLFIRKDFYFLENLNTGFIAELIYTGVMNNIIVLSYREFINDMARPAFYQELK
jgi:hypothetical protein